MTSNHPPRLAVWLLRRFNSGPHAESIAGDLLERYQVIMSPLWYWRQVASAIVADVIGSAGARPRHTTGMLAIGWIVYVVLSFPATAVTHWLTSATMRATFEQTNWSRETVLWLMLAERSLVAYVACAIAGWIVARMSRSAATVAAFALTMFVFEYSMVVILLAAQGIPAGATFSIAPAVMLIGRPISALIAGLCAVRLDEARSTTMA